jgi:hypothetical protein
MNDVTQIWVIYTLPSFPSSTNHQFTYLLGHSVEICYPASPLSVWRHYSCQCPIVVTSKSNRKLHINKWKYKFLDLTMNQSQKTVFFKVKSNFVTLFVNKFILEQLCWLSLKQNLPSRIEPKKFHIFLNLSKMKTNVKILLFKGTPSEYK